jgi:hypothetical protein
MLLSFGWFYLCAGIYSSLILVFTFKNQSTLKTKAMCCKWRRERKTTEGLAWGVTGNRSDMKGLAVTWESFSFN